MIPRPIIVGTTADFRPVVSQDENAHAAYPCFEAGTRPAPVLPAAQVPGLPDALLPILLDVHTNLVGLAKCHCELANTSGQPNKPTHFRMALESAAKATTIVQALRDAGHAREAAMLRKNAKALEEALYAVPEDLQERMDLMDMAVPGAGA